MTCTPSTADSILSTTALDWGLAPRQPPAETGLHSARPPRPDDSPRAPLRGEDRRRDAVHAE